MTRQPLSRSGRGGGQIRLSEIAAALRERDLAGAPFQTRLFSSPPRLRAARIADDPPRSAPDRRSLSRSRRAHGSPVAAAATAQDNGRDPPPAKGSPGAGWDRPKTPTRAG